VVQREYTHLRVIACHIDLPFPTPILTSQTPFEGTEAEALFDLGRTSPGIIDLQFVLQHFRTLAVVDRGVTELGDETAHLYDPLSLSSTAGVHVPVHPHLCPHSPRILRMTALVRAPPCNSGAFLFHPSLSSARSSL
jgi:hypothetical protein